MERILKLLGKKTTWTGITLAMGAIGGYVTGTIGIEIMFIGLINAAAIVCGRDAILKLEK